jgi:glutamate-1-semialdehyde 2,1-aminomutase
MARHITCTEKSRVLYQAAKDLIVGGVASSLHKSVHDEYPIYIDRGQGSKIYDVDGNEYIDYMGAFGPMIFGYCPESINEAVIAQVLKGSQFAAPTQSLNQVARELVDMIPCAELVAFQSSGTEANMAAFRVARAFTGKQKILKFEGNYHGWSDEELISVRPQSLEVMGPRDRPCSVLGSPGQSELASESVIVCPWNDLEVLAHLINIHKHELAAVITEPIMLNCEPVFPRPGYLEGLRKLTAENEIVLIFDEVITGFRLARGGAQEYYRVFPDVCTFAKAVAGGFQLAGLAGRREVMEAGVYFSGTFNANPIALAACMASLRELQKPDVYENLARITKRIIDGISMIGQRNKLTMLCDGVGSIWQLAFGISERMNDYRDNFKVDKTAYQRFRSGCLKRGIRVHPSLGRFYTSTAHSDKDVDISLSVFEEILDEMSKGR